MINPKKKISLHVTAIVCVVLATLKDDTLLDELELPKGSMHGEFLEIIKPLFGREREKKELAKVFQASGNL